MICKTCPYYLVAPSDVETRKKIEAGEAVIANDKGEPMEPAAALEAFDAAEQAAGAFGTCHGGTPPWGPVRETDSCGHHPERDQVLLTLQAILQALQT